MGSPLPPTLGIVDTVEHMARCVPPAIAFHAIHQASQSPPPAPLFVLGPSNPQLARQIYGNIHLRPIGCTSFTDAALAPTGIAIKDRVAFFSHALNLPEAHVNTVIARLNREPMPTLHVAGPVACLLGANFENYGHLLVDYLPRLWILEQCGYDIATLRFPVPRAGFPRSMEILHDIGIDDSQFVREAAWTSLLVTDQLVLPSLTRHYERIHPCFGPATRFWIDRVRRRAGLPPPKPSRKLYLSRRGIGGTRILTNAGAIEQMAERSGFEMVFPENLPFIEQVRMFGEASQIVGEYGSALHNVIFAAPGVPVCALRGTLREPSCLQTGIGAAMGQPTGYVFGQTEGEGFTHRFTVDVSDFLRGLEIMALAARA